MSKGIHQPISVPVNEDGLRQIEADLAMESQVTGVRRDCGGNWARSHVPQLIAEIRRLRGDKHAAGCAFDTNRPYESVGSCVVDCPIGGGETRERLARHHAGEIAESRFKVMREGGKWHLFYLATDDTARDFRTLFTGEPDECEDRRIRYIEHLRSQIVGAFTH